MMKKALILALAVLAGATALQAADKKDKKKKKENVEVKQPVVLSNGVDSVSYALGINTTNGLIPYLSQQLNVDTAYMVDFIRGFEDTMDQVRKKSLTAYGAGISIANMVEQRMIPAAKKQLQGVADSINNELFFRGSLSFSSFSTTRSFALLDGGFASHSSCVGSSGFFVRISRMFS